MTIRLRDIYGPGFTHAEYRRALQAGHETGWWNEHGIPAPWPDDFLNPDSGWTSTGEPAHPDKPRHHNGGEPF